MTNPRASWQHSLAARLCATTEGLSLRTVAQRTGYSHETVRRYTLYGNAPAHFIVAVAGAFKVDIRWLLTGKGRP